MDLKQRNGESAIRYAICSVYKPALVSMLLERWYIQWPLAIMAGAAEWSYQIVTRLIQLRLVYWGALILAAMWILIAVDFITGFTRAYTADEDLRWRHGIEWTLVKMANTFALVLGASVIDIFLLGRLAVMVAIGLLIGVKELISAVENTRYATPEFKQYVRSFLPWRD